MRLILALLFLLAYAFLGSSALESVSPYESSQCQAGRLSDEFFSISEQYLKSIEEYQLGPEHAQGLETYALYYMTTAVRLAPNRADYWTQLSEIQRRMGQFSSAMESLHRALDLDPSNPTTIESKESFRAFLNEQGYDSSALDQKFSQLRRRHTILPVPQYSPEEFSARLAEHLAGASPSDVNEESSQATFSRENFSTFFSRHAELFSRPFVIKNYAGKQKSRLLTQFNPRALQRLYGDETVDFYPQGLKEKEASRAIMSSLREAVDYLYCPRKVMDGSASLSANRRTYIQWNLLGDRFDELLSAAGLATPGFFQDSLLLNQCLSGTGEKDRFSFLTHWKMLVLGEGEGATFDLTKSRDEAAQTNDELLAHGCQDPLIAANDPFCQPGAEPDQQEQGRGGAYNEGGGMFLHRDGLRVPSFQLQAYGKKLWHLCPGSLSQKLRKKKPGYDATRAAKEVGSTYSENVYYSSDETEDFEAVEDGSSLNLFSPDYSEYPLLSSARCFEALVSPGDLVYYPQGYYHQTHCPGKDACVSISGSLILPQAIPRFISELMRECDQSVDVKEKKFKDTSFNSQNSSGEEDDVEGQIGPDQDFLDSFVSFFLKHSVPEGAGEDYNQVPPLDSQGGRFFPKGDPICSRLPTCYQDWWGYISQGENQA